MAAGTFAGTEPGVAQASCKAPRELVRFTAPLQNMQRALANKSEFRIVALGSSSTSGTGASSPTKRYPRRLEAELNRRFDPDRNFEVLNLGVGGQLAADMLARISTEVLPLQPQLVIWQTGVNDAIRGVKLQDFHASLTKGVDTLRARGIDVILLDMQYYPRSEQVAGYDDYLAAMRTVAKEKSVPILHRFAIMKHLISSGQFTPAQLYAPDLFHQNDLSYGCVSNLLADAIQDGLASRPQSLVREAAAR
jgi:lysophospholipase L1-like esterase